MSQNYRGIIQIRLDINATAEQIEEVENALLEGFQLEISILDFFGREKLQALSADASRKYLDFEYSLDDDLYGMDPLQSAMDLVAAQTGCFGVMWIDCESMFGHYEFSFSQNVSDGDRFDRSNGFLLARSESLATQICDNHALYVANDENKSSE